MLAVRPGYFSGRDYIKTEEWAQRWKEALELPYTPIVHLAALRKPFDRSAAEIAKYSLKISNLIELLNEIPDIMLADLHWGLSGLRLFLSPGYFGKRIKICICRTWMTRRAKKITLKLLSLMISLSPISGMLVLGVTVLSSTE